MELNDKEKPLYFYLPSNLHYYSINNVGKFVSDPEFYSLWSGYDPSALGTFNDPMFLFEKLKGEGLDLRKKLQDCIERAFEVMPGENVCDVLRVEAEQKGGLTYRDSYFRQLSFVRDKIQSKKFNAKNDPTFDLSGMYKDFYDIPSEEQYKAAALMSEKENYYCLLHALYEVGNMQLGEISGDKYAAEYPISINSYPNDMKDMIVALAKKMYGDKCISSTNGKDFNFVSFVDNLGRGEVMMFSDTSEFLVPTQYEIGSYSNKVVTIMKSNPDPYDLEQVKKLMKNRDYDYNGYDFVDGTYGLRTVIAAIKSISENKIES